MNVKDWLCEGEGCEHEGLATGMQGTGCVRAGDWLHEDEGLAMQGQGIGYPRVENWLCKGEGLATGM